MFAATQALGWALFSSSLVCLIHLTVQAARGMAYCINCWVYATGSVMLASQLVRLLLPVQAVGRWDVGTLRCASVHACTQCSHGRHARTCCSDVVCML